MDYKARAGRYMNVPTHSKPPRAIFDVLHKAEEQGITLPSNIENWWEDETKMDQEEDNPDTIPPLTIHPINP